jgi:uncharacterized protein YoxC
MLTKGNTIKEINKAIKTMSQQTESINRETELRKKKEPN